MWRETLASLRAVMFEKADSATDTTYWMSSTRGVHLSVLKESDRLSLWPAVYVKHFPAAPLIGTFRPGKSSQVTTLSLPNSPHTSLWLMNLRSELFLTVSVL